MPRDLLRAPWPCDAVRDPMTEPNLSAFLWSVADLQQSLGDQRTAQGIQGLSQ